MSSRYGRARLLRARSDLALIDWTREEERLHTRLPADYKEFVGTYQPDVDDFLWVLHPSANWNLDLLSQVETKVSAARTVRDQDAREVPYPLYPEAGGLLPWGFTDNGDTCYWVTSERDSDAWSVAINASRGPDWYEFSGPMTDFILSVLRGDVRVPFFPSDFPS